MTNYNIQKAQASLLIVLIVLVVILVIGTGVASLTVKELRMATDVKDSAQALYAADAGMERALYEVVTGTGSIYNGGTGNIGSPVTLTLSGSGASYSVEWSGSSLIFLTLIKSKGSKDGVTRTIERDITTKGMPWGVRSLSIYNNRIHIAASGSKKIAVFDISSPSSPSFIKSIDLFNSGGSQITPTAIERNPNSGYFFIGENGDPAKVYVFDFSDLDNPVRMGSFNVQGGGKRIIGITDLDFNSSGDTVYISGNFPGAPDNKGIVFAFNTTDLTYKLKTNEDMKSIGGIAVDKTNNNVLIIETTLKKYHIYTSTLTHKDEETGETYGIGSMENSITSLVPFTIVLGEQWSSISESWVVALFVAGTYSVDPMGYCWTQNWNYRRCQGINSITDNDDTIKDLELDNPQGNFYKDHYSVGICSSSGDKNNSVEIYNHTFDNVLSNICCPGNDCFETKAYFKESR